MTNRKLRMGCGESLSSQFGVVRTEPRKTQPTKLCPWCDQEHYGHNDLCSDECENAWRGEYL